MGTVSLKWIDSQLMVGVDSFGHPIVTGSRTGRDPEWAALKPSDLLLLSAAACSAYDVVLILEKQHAGLINLEIQCSGEQDEEPPYVFRRIHLRYTLTGDIPAARVARAIKLSEEKYCSVINTLKGCVEITSEFEIFPERPAGG